jgi:hypothetical protein
VASVTCDFIDAAFVMVWDGVARLLFYEVFIILVLLNAIPMLMFLNKLVILRICGL